MIATTTVQAAVIAAFTSAAESMPTKQWGEARGQGVVNGRARSAFEVEAGASSEIDCAADQPGSLPAALSLGTGIPNAA